MLIVNSVKCVYGETDRMFHGSANDLSIDLLDPPRKIGMSDRGTIKLKFSLVCNESGKNALYHALYLAPGEYHGTIPMKQYYLIVE